MALTQRFRRVDIELEQRFDEPEQITVFRRIGLQQFYEVNGKTFAPPGGGVVSDGGPAQATKKFNQTVYELKQRQSEWVAQFSNLKGRLRYLPDGYFGVEDSNGNLWLSVRVGKGSNKFIPHPQESLMQQKLQEAGIS